LPTPPPPPHPATRDEFEGRSAGSFTEQPLVIEPTHDLGKIK